MEVEKDDESSKTNFVDVREDPKDIIPINQSSIKILNLMTKPNKPYDTTPRLDPII